MRKEHKYFYQRAWLVNVPTNPEDKLGIIKLEVHDEWLEHLAKDPRVIDLRKIIDEEVKRAKD